MAFVDDLYTFIMIYFPVYTKKNPKGWNRRLLEMLVINLIITFDSGMALVAMSFAIYLTAPIVLPGSLSLFIYYVLRYIGGDCALCFAVIIIIANINATYYLYFIDIFYYKQFFRERKYIDFFVWGSVTAACITGLVNIINFIKYYCLALYHFCVLIGYCCYSIFDADCWSTCYSNCNNCCNSCLKGLSKCCEYVCACMYLICNELFKCVEGICLFIYDGMFYLYDKCCCCCNDNNTNNSYENHKHDNVYSEAVKHIFVFIWKSILFIIIYSYRGTRYCLNYITCKKIECLESNKCCDCCCDCCDIFSKPVENPYDELLEITCMQRVEKGRKYIISNIIKGFKRFYRYKIFHYAFCDVIVGLIVRLYVKIFGEKDVSVYPSDNKKTIKIPIENEDDNNSSKVIISCKGTKIPINSKGTKVVINSEEEEKLRIIEENMNIPKDDNNNPLFFRLPSRDSMISIKEKKKSIIKLSIIKSSSPLLIPPSSQSTYQLPSSSHSTKSFRPHVHTANDIPGYME